MRTITEIQFSLDKMLSSEEMAQVKGGGGAVVIPPAAIPAIPAVPAIPGVSSAVKAISAIPSITSDDKRRERPGGGITTL